jgi:transcriptional antiterminator RfaH
MAFWCCARFELHREQVAKHFLALAGFATYIPQMREQRSRRGRRFDTIVPLFPSYGFIQIVEQWHAARWSLGVLGLIMDGIRPATVPDNILDDIRKREVNGIVQLPKQRGLQAGDPVRVTGGPFTGHLALFEEMKPHQRVEILLAFLGARQRVTLQRSDIAQVT